MLAIDLKRKVRPNDRAARSGLGVRLRQVRPRTLALALLSALAVIAIGGASGASAVFPPTSQIALPANADVNPNAQLTAISCTGDETCVGVGSYVNSAGLEQAMASIEQSGNWLNAVALTPPANAAGPGVNLLGVSCASTGNCTAVGSYDNTSQQQEAMTVTESGGTWSQAVSVAPPSDADQFPEAVFNAVSCPSAGSCTAVGQYYSDTDASVMGMTATASGGTFPQATEVTAPGDAYTTPSEALYGVSCPSAGVCTAVGDYSTNSSDIRALSTVAASGGSFAQAIAVTAPVGAESVVQLDAVSCTSSENCTAVGQYETTASPPAYEGMAATESGTGIFGTAVAVTAPTNADTTNAAVALYGISCPTTNGDCTAVGTYTDNSNPNDVQALAVTETSGTFGTAVELEAPTSAGSNPGAALNGVSCSTTCEAVGNYSDTAGNGLAMTAAEPTGWSQLAEVINPTDAGSPRSYLGNVSCSSAGTCTAVGDYVDNSGDQQAVAATSSDGTFATPAVVAAPAGAAGDPQASLNDVSCTSAGNCTAAGTYTDGSGNEQAMIAVSSGGTFGTAVEVALPGNANASPDAAFFGVSCASAGNCTAVGTYDVTTTGDQESFAATQTNGGSFTSVEVNPPTNAAADPGAALTSVSCTSAGNCVGVGNFATNTTNAGVDSMYVTDIGGTWSTPAPITPPADGASPPDATLESVSCASAGNCVAVGSYEQTSGEYQAAATVETNGNFSDTDYKVTAPANAATYPEATLDGVSCAASGTCTAVGLYVDSSGSEQAMATSAAADAFAQATLVSTGPVSAPTDPGGALFGVGCPSAGSCTAVGNYGEGSYMMAASSVPALALTTSLLPTGAVGQSYRAALAASGGVGSYTYSISSGSLPAGLSLSSSGVISGTPTSASNASVTFRVSDPGPPSQSATALLSPNIVPAPSGGGGGGGGGSDGISISISPASQTISNGGTATWTVTVTNTGGGYLFNVATTDPSAPNCVQGYGQFASLQDYPPNNPSPVTFTCTLSGVTSSFTNTVSDSGVGGDGATVTASASASVTVSGAASAPTAPVSTTTHSSSTPPKKTTTVPAAATVTPSAVAPIVLDKKHPSLTLTTKVSKKTTLVLILRAKDGKTLATWTIKLTAGTHKLSLLVPLKARKTGHDTLRITGTGGKTKTVSIVVRAK